jgi:DNA-binding response OmpR family regulator
MPEAKTAKKRILVVDDESEALEYISDILEERYEVFTAPGGRQALDILSRERIDLVLLDIAMQGMDGNEVLRKIRSAPMTETLPVCIVTAIAAPKQEQNSRDMGATDYLIKPFRIETLIDKVAMLLGEQEEGSGRVFEGNDEAPE